MNTQSDILKTTYRRRIAITLGIVVSALSLIAFQLSQFAVDASLRNWNDGPVGYQNALAFQKTTTKPIALFFYTDWCASCKKLRENILSSREFEQYLENVIPVKINPENSIAARQIADKFGVYGYPVFLIFRPDTQTIHRINTTGNLTPDKFIELCNQAVKI